MTNPNIDRDGGTTIDSIELNGATSHGSASKIPTTTSQLEHPKLSSLLAPLFTFALPPMPKTRNSQRNKVHTDVAEATSAPSTQLVAITGTVDALEPQVMTKANKPTTKRTRTRANDTTGNDSDTAVAPAKKKTKVADSAPKVKAKPVPEPRETLPERKGRNKHPGAIAKPRIKRTTAEVEAENLAKAEMKRRLEELEEEKKKLWAQMEIDEDERELERQVKAVRRLSDVQVIVTDREAISDSESEGEDFDMDVDASDSEDVNTDPKPGPVERKKKVSCTDSSMCS
jgi:hypothetical protein